MKRMPQLLGTLVLLLVAGTLSLLGAQRESETEYLSDHPDWLLSARQDWGELGFNVAAHQKDRPGEPLCIGQTQYAKGLGHHANGSILFALDGEFSAFDAVVGIQHQTNPAGSVIFRVRVDGQQRFDSGVMFVTNAPKSIHLSVTGGQELLLEADDAGDGITCDMADWAEARLTRISTFAQVKRLGRVDVAPFARVVSSDPNRLDGCRSTRIQEFAAADLALETPLSPDHSGAYWVDATTNSLAAIGLQWLQRRTLTEVGIEFVDRHERPQTISVQGWFGESAWQGEWRTLTGETKLTERGFAFRIGSQTNNNQIFETRKIRWVFPARAGTVRVRSLSAFTRSRWATAQLRIEADPKPGPSRGEVSIDNGLVNNTTRVDWRLGRPVRLRVRYSRPSVLNSDPTVLRFRLPTGSVGVAVADVLSNGCVYVPAVGLFVAREPLVSTRSDYEQMIANQKTILQKVRDLPEQTLAQAMAKTHHEAQREGPVMLSLACDNTKFIVERNGEVRFALGPQIGGDWLANAARVRSRLGDGSVTDFSRTLEGGWLPIPVNRANSAGITYTQRTFVAPCDEPGSDPRRLNRRSVGVLEFTVRNDQERSADAQLDLTFSTNAQAQAFADFSPHSQGHLVRANDRPFAYVDLSRVAPLQSQLKPGSVGLTGRLAPGEQARCIVFLAGEGLPPETLSSLKDPETLHADTVAYWKSMLEPAMQVETPEPLINDLIRSSQIRCLIDARNEADGTRVAPWIAAMSYGPLESEANSIIRAMDLWGHPQFAQRALEFFIHRYHAAGFLTTGYTTFGTAWHLWTLGEHVRLNQAFPWLKHWAPEVTRVGSWIIRQTEKTKRLDADGTPLPGYGLMPPGVMADWNAFAYHYCLDAYYYAALRELGQGLSDIRDTNGAVFLHKAAELREHILRAYRWTQARSPALPLSNGTWVPAYPSQVHSPGKLADYFPGQDAGRSWCYDVELGAHQLIPAGVFEPNGTDATQILEHMEDVQFLADGWFDYPSSMNHQDWYNLGGFSKVQPYYTRNAEIYAQRDDVKPFLRSYFNTLAAMLNPEVLTFWEHFHHSGAWDKTHETGYFLQQSRWMLLSERGDEVWLAPFVPSEWLRDGRHLQVTRAPTSFGSVDYTVTSHIAANYIEANVHCRFSRSPSAIVLRVRHPQIRPIRRALVNGAGIEPLDAARECIRLAPARDLSIRIEY